jgi:hypothetical protein
MKPGSSLTVDIGGADSLVDSPARALVSGLTEMIMV